MARPEVAEAALAHAVGGVEGAYARSDLFERRRTLMQAWSDYGTSRHTRVEGIVTGLKTDSA